MKLSQHGVTLRAVAFGGSEWADELAGGRRPARRGLPPGDQQLPRPAERRAAPGRLAADGSRGMHQTGRFNVIGRLSMARRRTKNVTDIPRIGGISCNDAWVYVTCVSCGKPNFIRIGLELLTSDEAYETSEWECEHCGFVHEKGANLPFKNWPKGAVVAESVAALRFWQAFFRTATEHPESHWKRCNACGRLLPFSAFSRHKGWGPLERQMECRACKGAINAILNPKRSKQQLHEGSVRRRAADMLLEAENERIDHKALSNDSTPSVSRLERFLKSATAAVGP